MKFRGHICIGIPSQKSPRGAMGRRIVLPLSVVRDRIHTLGGCAVPDGHNGRVVGVITKATIIGLRMVFEGELQQTTSRDPETYRFSYEIVEAHVLDYAARRVWRIKRFDRFTGMALVGSPQRPAHESSSLRMVR